MGTGAIAGSWNPVLDALGNRIPDRSPHAANVYFATLVHRLRWLKAMSVKPTIAEAHRLPYAHALEEALKELREVTTGIAASLRAWDGNKLRPEASIIRERLLYRDFGFSVVSTNWDFSAGELLEHDRCCGIHYLHGTYDVGLYLPGEVIDEPYRGSDHLSEFLSSAVSTVHELRDASRLVVYGLSISPLDAELGFLLQAAARQRKQPFTEVFVVDPNHKEVIPTLRVHLGNQKTMTPSGKILLVDNTPEFLDVYRTILATEGYEVDEALDGASALARLEDSGWDLVLLDRKLQGPAGPDTGLDLMQGIRARAPGAKVIIVTGYADEDRTPLWPLPLGVLHRGRRIHQGLRERAAGRTKGECPHCSHRQSPAR